MTKVKAKTKSFPGCFPSFPHFPSVDEATSWLESAELTMF